MTIKERLTISVVSLTVGILAAWLGGGGAILLPCGVLALAVWGIWGDDPVVPATKEEEKE